MATVVSAIADVVQRCCRCCGRSLVGVVSWTLAVSSLPFVFVCSGVSLVLTTLALTVKASPPGQQPGSGMQPAGSVAVKIFKCLSLNSEIIKFGGLQIDLLFYHIIILAIVCLTTITNSTGHLRPLTKCCCCLAVLSLPHSPVRPLVGQRSQVCAHSGLFVHVRIELLRPVVN